MSSEPTVAVVGATGAVGREMLSILAERQFPAGKITALASERSAGEKVSLGDKSITVEELKPESFEGIDIALFSAGGSVSTEFAPIAVEAGTIVIDNSSAFRMDPEVALIVPEVNSQVLQGVLSERPGGLIIANPNCSTIQLVVVLKPIADAAGLKRVVVTTYQAVSGAGKAAMDELWEQTLALFNQNEVKPQKFAHQIAFNCIPHCDVFLDNSYTKEEMKLVNESRKILGDADLRLTSTAVRVPVFNSHSEVVNIETSKKLTAEAAQDLLMRSPGIIVLDNPAQNEYPLARDVSGTDATYVGRIREDESLDTGLNMWIVADNLRKGAALNAVQIAELVLQERFAQ